MSWSFTNKLFEIQNLNNIKISLPTALSLTLLLTAHCSLISISSMSLRWSLIVGHSFVASSVLSSPHVSHLAPTVPALRSISGGPACVVYSLLTWPVLLSSPCNFSLFSPIDTPVSHISYSGDGLSCVMGSRAIESRISSSIIFAITTTIAITGKLFVTSFSSCYLSACYLFLYVISLFAVVISRFMSIFSFSHVIDVLEYHTTVNCYQQLLLL